MFLCKGGRINSNLDRLTYAQIQCVSSLHNAKVYCTAIAQQDRGADCTVLCCGHHHAEHVWQQRPENNQENAYRTPRATKGFPFVCLAPGLLWMGKVAFCDAIQHRLCLM